MSSVVSIPTANLGVNSRSSSELSKSITVPDLKPSTKSIETFVPLCNCPDIAPVNREITYQSCRNFA